VTDATQPKRRVRNTALALMTIAIGFYVAFIAMSIYRSRHG
jgi:biopolymer transport protein ExbB/TolQ